MANSDLDFIIPIYEGWLKDLPYNPASFSPLLGGQNWTACCALMVNDTVIIDNNTISLRPGQTFFDGNISTLVQFGAFPCGLQFNASAEYHPPSFWTPYSWCTNRCPGWAVTSADDFNNWLKPLISFILPALVFTLNIPRRRKVGLPKTFFSVESLGIGTFCLFVLWIPVATLIVALDLLAWLAVVFATAGPVIMSGLYEAFLDARILDFVSDRIKANKLTIQERAHALLIILIGNLDQDPAWERSKSFVRGLPSDSIRQRFRSVPVATTHHESVSQTNLDSSLHPLPPATHERGRQGSRSDRSSSPSQSPAMPPVSPTMAPSSSGGILSATGGYSAEQHRRIHGVKVKLDAMLDSQLKFGSTVGAAILFYIGSFTYSVFDVESNLGDYLTAHQLAFGMFWMIIPHVAIVSSLLLAGNNPSVWQGAEQRMNFEDYELGPMATGNGTADNAATVPTSPLSTAHDNRLQRLKATFEKLRSPAFRPLQRSYNPTHSGDLYHTAWIWNRGCNKAMWVAQLANEYNLTKTFQEEILQTRFGSHLWFSVVGSWILIFIPPFFGGLVSYNTPRVGLSCRSLVMLCYGLSQAILILLTLIDWCYWKRDAKGNFTAFSHKSKRSLSDALLGHIWYILYLVAVFVGLFTSIAGTLFILTGVFRNCLCIIPAVYWLDRSNPDARMFWNDSNQEQIDMAQKYWFPTGVAGAVILVFIAFVGWWYQRSLLARFHTLVSRIDAVDEGDIAEGVPTEDR